MATNKTVKNTRIGFTLIGVGALGLVALATYIRSTPPPLPVKPLDTPLQRNEPLQGVPGQKETTIGKTGGDPQDGRQIMVPVPEVDDKGQLKMKSRKHKLDPSGEDARLSAVNEFLSSSNIVPKGAKAMSISMRDRTAVIEFNEAFNKTYGTIDEQTILTGLRMALGQFDDVDKILLMVSGKPLDSLGSVDTTEPLDVIRTTSKEQPVDPMP
ncbi:MAG: GerMN domain-containing protein [Armatimonadetes bacterium]|nr:GerMN domain-containing protein [Armatimonadota bacterium]